MAALCPAKRGQRRRAAWSGAAPRGRGHPAGRAPGGGRARSRDSSCCRERAGPCGRSGSSGTRSGTRTRRCSGWRIGRAAGWSDRRSAAGASGGSRAPGTAEARPGLVEVDVTSLAHPALPAVISPVAGEIAASSLPIMRRVHRNEKLFEVKPRVTAEAARPAEPASPVKASADGLAQPVAASGDFVEQGGVLATISDPSVWTGRASLRGAAVTREWSCAVTPATGGSRATCRIDRVALTPAGAQVSVTIEASRVPWLVRAEQKLRLLLAPPRTP